MTSRPNTLDACFSQGADARQAGRKLAENPYDIRTEEHREWSAGWSATFDLDEDQDASSTRIGPGDTDDADGPDGNDPEGPGTRR